ncbi:MAG: YitT family protein [Lachnospiraceae bacterium]|nr:YitT family protein [Lachnospiraceae bacterium]
MKKEIWSRIVEFFFIALGATIAAFAIEEFLVPCTILDGGIVGVGIIINNLTGFKLGVLTLILNAPFFLIGARKIGRLFLVKSATAMVIFSFMLEVFGDFVNATEDHLLAVCFGGVILGIGVGLVIKYGGCLDGTETIAILINRKTSFPVGRMVLIFNIVIYGVAGILFGVDRAMYSLLTYFITSKVLDMIENGIDQAKQAMIITDDATEISNLIYSKLGRTVTIMEGEGLVSGQKKVLYVVLTQFELGDLKSIIKSIDASAFITVSDVSEIIGTHVKSKSLVKKGIIPEEIVEENNDAPGNDAPETKEV